MANYERTGPVTKGMCEVGCMIIAAKYRALNLHLYLHIIQRELLFASYKLCSQSNSVFSFTDPMTHKARLSPTFLFLLGLVQQ